MPETRRAPALTAEEWKWWLEGEPPITELDPSFIGDYAESHGGADSRHACAAICLYGQPFGFSREDVALLRRLTESNDYEPGDAVGWLDVSMSPDETQRLRSLVERIAALLPP